MARGMIILEPNGWRRCREDEEEEDQEYLTDLQGKRPVGTMRRKKKKSTRGGASKNSIGPLVDKVSNPVLVQIIKEEQESS